VPIVRIVRIFSAVLVVVVVVAAAAVVVVQNRYMIFLILFTQLSAFVIKWHMQSANSRCTLK